MPQPGYATALLPAVVTVSFGSVSRTGDEGRDGPLTSTLDIQVPVVITIDPPTAILSADIIVIVSVTGGNATGRLIDCSNITTINLLQLLCMFMSSGHCCIEPGTVYIVICYLSPAEGQDFTLSRRVMTFDIGANNGNTISVFIDVLDDLLVEGTECFTLSGSTASNQAAASFVGGDVTVCIDDNGCKCVHQWRI